MQERSNFGHTSVYCLDFAELNEVFDYICKAMDEGESDFVAISQDWAKLPAHSKEVR